jgi:hypothetical protein
MSNFAVHLLFTSPRPQHGHDEKGGISYLLPERERPIIAKVSGVDTKVTVRWFAHAF